MHIRYFRAANLQAALADIRQQMGPGALVLHTRQVREGWRGWLGCTEVEVTAGLVEPGDPAADSAGQDVASSLTEANSIGVGDQQATDRAEELLAGQLYRQGVPFDVAQRWLTSAAGFAANLTDSRPLHDVDQTAVLWEHLQRAVTREINLSGPIRTQPGDRRIIALVGPTGVGKTTTVAKLAAGFRIEAKRRVGLLTIDTYRIAAVQQLRAYADIMDLPMRVVESPDQMQPALAELGDVDLVLIDTAGRSPRSDARVQQLELFLRAARPDETHLVLSATSSTESLRTTLRGFSPVGAGSVILTKLDETSSTAAALAALTAGDRFMSTPLSYVTNGQQVPDDISVADAGPLTRALLPVLPGWERNTAEPVPAATARRVA